ncbi:MAG: c-type cytochrome [Planctomycetaceae bacterium]|nr:c-type cytochrome [Planctomycetaceae bacterium]
MLSPSISRLILICCVLLTPAGFAFANAPVVVVSIEALSAEVETLETQLDDPQTLNRLIAIDDGLTVDQRPGIPAIRGRILNLLGGTGEESALEYVRRVFENQSEFRDEAAMALSLHSYRKPTNLQDWRFLIRSLTVTRGEQTVSVMKALLRYRQRATNSHWIKRVLLQTEQLNEQQRPVAIELLGHWTGLNESDPETAMKADLAFYQNWYAQKWPEEQPATWPEEPETQRWKYAPLLKTLDQTIYSADLLEQGKAVYEKASCAKCHVKGDIGQNFGPDLSGIGALRQRSELLEGILYPSLEIHEDYPTVTVLSKDGKTISGLLSAGEPGSVKIVDPKGKATLIAQSEIEEIQTSSVSNMPAGGLEQLTEQEIIALFAFLQHQENSKKPFHGESQDQ